MSQAVEKGPLIKGYTRGGPSGSGRLIANACCTESSRIDLHHGRALARPRKGPHSELRRLGELRIAHGGSGLRDAAARNEEEALASWTIRLLLDGRKRVKRATRLTAQLQPHHAQQHLGGKRREVRSDADANGRLDVGDRFPRQSGLGPHLSAR
jgi:hypothetical protein